jgi:3-deoxy-manno-octulosonate cytidylyltransferase (CMP-KDO synthetase)
MNTILNRDELAEWRISQRAAGRKIVFTNGCYDILHAGHVQLLQAARALGDVLVVGVNSDASVKRLKGESRPINSQDARAFVLASLGCVDAVTIFPEDTPVETIETVRPDIHVKGGDYQPDDLPEAVTVRKHGGEVHIVPLREGFSTTGTLEKLAAAAVAPGCVLIIPARFGSTRFPGKPMAQLGSKAVLEYVIEAALKTSAQKPILVATDDDRIAALVRSRFQPEDAQPVMTSPDCATGTDRLAEVLQTRFPDSQNIVINIQGDEPFINPRHIDLLIEAMRADTSLPMATLATPIVDKSQIDDPNVVKVVLDANEEALYFSRCSIPFVRDEGENAPQKLRHLGVYAYQSDWLLQMAQLPPTPLENLEKLEQLRALENGKRIKVISVPDVISIAIDTPADLDAARKYLAQQL